jgi:hypothetical protein
MSHCAGRSQPDAAAPAPRRDPGRLTGASPGGARPLGVASDDVDAVLVYGNGRQKETLDDRDAAHGPELDARPLTDRS